MRLFHFSERTFFCLFEQTVYRRRVLFVEHVGGGGNEDDGLIGIGDSQGIGARGQFPAFVHDLYLGKVADTLIGIVSIVELPFHDKGILLHRNGCPFGTAQAYFK